MGEPVPTPNPEAMAEFLNAEQVRQGARLILEAFAAGTEAPVTDDQVESLLNKLYKQAGESSHAARSKIEAGLMQIALAPYVEDED